jgi:hypothetical protein
MNAVSVNRYGHIHSIIYDEDRILFVAYFSHTLRNFDQPLRGAHFLTELNRVCPPFDGELGQFNMGKRGLQHIISENVEPSNFISSLAHR